MKRVQVDPAELRIDGMLAAYRYELLADMNRYHGCDVYENERSCRADVYRVDHVIFPVMRKMLEDLFCHCGEPVSYGFDGDASHHRGMCGWCDPLRCDAYPGECGR